MEKTYPDGEVKCFRRKYFVVKIKKFIIEGNQKREVLEELPLHEEEIVNYEEVEFNEQDTFDTKVCFSSYGKLKTIALNLF